MPDSPDKVDVYLEVGARRTIAAALDWYGWCRVGRDEASALQALYDYAPRYARALRAARLGFRAPASPAAFVVRERIEGNATTDFGTPGLAPKSDARPVDDAELARFHLFLKACWRTFDAAVSTAEGKTLRLGPRGGGRDLDRIVAHVLGAEAAYMENLGWRHKTDQEADPREGLERERKAVLDALGAKMRGELPARGPRGGLRWSPRYFVRRSAWHVLDHAWEIEDRVE